MHEFRSKLGNDGRIIIPVLCRKYLQLQAGEELIIHIEKDELHISSLKNALKKAQARVQRYAKSKSLVEKLILTRQEDNKND
jgi:bifunctional DNA-binding transcriptional regulator/antitoxin component of YhaV-PrlF toxin-antitoxin module